MPLMSLPQSASSWERTVSDPIRVDVWSDVVCPWCYIGKRRLEQAIRLHESDPSAAPVMVTYHSFQLAPDTPTDLDESALEYLIRRKGVDETRARAMQSHVTHVASTVGLEYHFEKARSANTHLAHQLIHFAAEHEAQAEAKERVFKAHFTEGRDIGQIDTLVEIAGEAGLDPEQARDALETGKFEEAVEQDRDLAARIGINGVPFFVFDGKIGVSGAQPPETLLEAMRRAAQS